MKVLKFGGSSVADSKSINKVIQIIKKTAQKEHLLVVVSAFGKTTDILVTLAKAAKHRDEHYKNIFEQAEKHHLSTVKDLIRITEQSAVISQVKRLFNQLETLLEGCFLLEELTPKTLATISGFGELLAAYILAEALKEKGLEAVYKNSSELIVTMEDNQKVAIHFEKTNDNCHAYFGKELHQVTVLPGFIATTENGQPATLGRGGSDYSAAIFAMVLKASELQIWTDVSGLFTANPSVVKQAFPIAELSYQEAMELSHFGAKVLYPPTIQPVLEQQIPIRIKNTFAPKDKGTLISKKTNHKNVVKGISYIENIALLTLEGSGMIGITGFSKRLFGILSSQGINVIFITQASSEHSICLGIYDKDVKVARKSINQAFAFEIDRGKIQPTLIEQDLVIIALVGDQMKDHQGLSGMMFSTLGKNNVNIRAIAQGASEKNISAVIASKDAKKGLNTLHEQFFEENIKQLNLFVTGVGNVGERFLEQIDQQKDYLKQQLKLNLRVMGISNSTKMIFDQQGIDLSRWKARLTSGEPATLSSFYQRVKQLNLRNSVFVDNTASTQVTQGYASYLQHNIAVVTCNKIACSADFKNYQRLKNIAHKYKASFLFETNVGAGLPVIDTLKNLIISGDKIHKIQAVLSGSLNFVFNHFNSKITFCETVKKAQKEGYTEPDPKIDLSGIDVARKILILARESGANLELSDVENHSFLPQKSLDSTNNPDFYTSLTEFESHFQELYKRAAKKNCRLKYVAEFVDGKIAVGLQHIDKDHPFYHLEGSDNIVLFFTDRYPENPLQIKGAGAGAAVTASGIFADVIRVGNQ